MKPLKILTGDCRQILRTLPDNSVHCCVTSPPYFKLRDYGHEGQIGLEQTPDAYVAEMVAVFREVRRVLREDGTLFLNLGDSYFSGSQPGGTKSKVGSVKRSCRMFSRAAGGRHAAPYGTSGTELADSRERDCLCGSLCDACRRAYQIGKSHSDTRPVPTLGASIPASSLGHTEFLPDHLPTSDLPSRVDHIAAANRGLGQAVVRAAAPLPDAPGSTPHEFSRQPPERSHPSGQPSGCRLCGCSLQGSSQVFAHMAECNCGTLARGSVSGISGKGVVSSAYPYLTTESLKHKDLIGIPWRVAFALQADGWYLRQDIIWHKPNPMPESVTDRCTKAHEYLFLLSKSARYYFDGKAMKEPAVKGAAGSTFHRGKTREHQAGRASVKERKEDGTRNRRSVWSVSTRPYKGAHFAAYPTELIRPCIRAGCPVGGTVLDPFGGSGTTGQVALEEGRHAILCELHPEYVQLIERRTAIPLSLPPYGRNAGP